jgi:hypothetical protein
MKKCVPHLPRLVCFFMHQKQTVHFINL